MPWVLIGKIDTSVMGCNHYPAKKPQSAGAVMSLRRDLANPWDEHAIAVHTGEDCSSMDTHIGYLPRDLVKFLAGWMDSRCIKLAGISTGPCDNYRVPATVMVLSPLEQAAALQRWLANVAFRFTPVDIPAAAECAPAAAGVKRERDAAADEGLAAGGGAAAHEAADTADGQQAKSAKLEHDSQGSAAPLLGSQEEPVEAGLLAVPAVNLLPANIELGSKQVLHGRVCLSFDDQGAATISGTKCALLEGVLRTWPVLQRRSGKAGQWSSPPLDDLERYFLARMLAHMGPLAAGEPMPAPYPLDLAIPLRFRPCADNGTPLDGPMIAMGGRPKNAGRQYFAARDSNTPDGGRWIWADGAVPWV